MISFVVEGDPKPKGRPRVVRGVTYTPKETVQAERAVAFAARRAGVSKLKAGVELRVRFYRATRRRCDLDNLTKLVMDALNGLSWSDDDQVVSLVAHKAIDRDNPRTEVEVLPCEPIDPWSNEGQLAHYEAKRKG